MSDDNKLEGRKAALAIVQKINQNKEPPSEPESFDGLVQAIEALAESRPDMSGALEVIAEKLGELKKDDLDFSAIVQAIKSIELDASIDLEPIALQIEALAERPGTDLSPVVDKLDEIKKAMENNTKVLSDLVNVAKAAKVVTYDGVGRITEIKLKG